MHQVLMFGWEFPPQNKGGLGVACQGIVQGLLTNGLKVNLVLPSMHQSQSGEQLNIHNFIDLLDERGKQKLSRITVNSPIKAYMTPQTYIKEVAEITENQTKTSEKKSNKLYGKDLFQEIKRLEHSAKIIAKKVPHSVIHAHDWMTFPAAISAQKTSKKPLIVHIHATEMDRTGGNPNQTVYEIEKLGLEHSDKVIAVSEFTKQKLIKYYEIPADKIIVVHNAISKKVSFEQTKTFKRFQKSVLFLGRITLQKGPDYFLRAAQIVLKYLPETVFIMAGDGDMMQNTINLALDLGIEKNIVFTGFLTGPDIDRAYQEADLFVMPSISEPFGLTALEALRNNTPVLISKQSGVNEVIKNALKVDFWDIDQMANLMITYLKEPALQDTLEQHAPADLNRSCWVKQTKKIHKVYHDLIKQS